MSDPPPITRELVRELVRLAESRRGGPDDGARGLSPLEAARAERDERARMASESREHDAAILAENDVLRRRLVEKALVDRRNAALAVTAAHHREVDAEADEVEAEAMRVFQEKCRRVDGALDSGEQSFRENADEQAEELATRAETLADLQRRRDDFVGRHRLARHLRPARPGPPDLDPDVDPLDEALALFKELIESRASSGAPGVVVAVAGAGVAAVAGLAGALTAGASTGVAAAGAVAAVTAAASWLASSLKARGLAGTTATIDQSLEAARVALETESERLDDEIAARNLGVADQRSAHHQAAREAFAEIALDNRERRERRHQRIELAWQARRDALDRAALDLPRWRANRLDQRIETLNARSVAMIAEADSALALAERVAEAERARRAKAHDREVRARTAALLTEVGWLELACAGSLGPWEALDGDDRSTAAVPPRGVAFGRVSVEVGGSGRQIAVPVHLPVEGSTNVVFEARTDDDEREAARAAEVVALRALAAFPPGRLRITLLGHGGPFGRFDALRGPDDDDGPVDRESLDDPSQAQTRLAELADDLGRDQRGGPDGPIRLLVVAGFPRGFDEAGARRLAEVLERGPARGALCVVATAGRAGWPPGVSTDDFKAFADVLAIEKGGANWDEPDLLAVPIVIDASPDEAIADRLLRGAGGDAVGPPFGHDAGP